MRAYMSTGAAHAEDGSRYVPGFNVETAEREARAILAETEPIPEGYSQADRMHRISVSEIAAGAFAGDSFPALWCAERALAESLSAFIEQEF